MTFLELRHNLQAIGFKAFLYENPMGHVSPQVYGAKNHMSSALIELGKILA